MIYIKSIVIVLLNNNKFLAISTYINLKKIKHKRNKNLSTFITLTQDLLRRPKKNHLEGPNLTPSPGSHNDKLISDKRSYKTSQRGPK